MNKEKIILGYKNLTLEEYLKLQIDQNHYELK